MGLDKIRKDMEGVEEEFKRVHSRANKSTQQEGTVARKGSGGDESIHAHAGVNKASVAGPGRPEKRVSNRSKPEDKKAARRAHRKAVRDAARMNPPFAGRITTTTQQRLTALKPVARDALVAIARLHRPGKLVFSKDVQKAIRKSQPQTSRILTALERAGFVEVAQGSHPQVWNLTQSGRMGAVALAEESDLIHSIAGSEGKTNTPSTGEPTVPGSGPAVENSPAPTGRPGESLNLVRRLHDLRVEVPFLRKPSKEELKEEHGWLWDEKLGWPRGTGYVIDGISLNVHKGAKVDKLIVIFPPIAAQSSQQAKEKALVMLQHVLGEFKKRYPSTVFGSQANVESHTSRVEASVQRQQIGLVGDEFARQAHQQRLSIRREGWEFDASVWPPESEATGADADDRLERYADHIVEVGRGQWDHVLPALGELGKLQFTGAMQRESDRRDFEEARRELYESMAAMANREARKQLEAENADLRELIRRSGIGDLRVKPAKPKSSPGDREDPSIG